MSRLLTPRQQRCLHAVAEGGRPSTIQVENRVNYSLTREEREARVSERDAVTPCKQLAAKGLLVEHGVKFGPKTWTLTDAGRTATVGVAESRFAALASREQGVAVGCICPWDDVGSPVGGHRPRCPARETDQPKETQ